MKPDIFTSAKTSASLDDASLKYFVHEDIKREYLTYIPTSYAHMYAAPIVLNCHGFGSTASAQLALSDWRDLAEKHGIILIYPQGLELQKGASHWNPDPISSDSKSIRTTWDL